jgi:hypothetical protein
VINHIEIIEVFYIHLAHTSNYSTLVKAGGGAFDFLKSLVWQLIPPLLNKGMMV